VFIGRLWIGLLPSECEKKRIFLTTEAIYLHVCRVVVELVTGLNLYCDKRSALGYSVTTPKTVSNVDVCCVTFVQVIVCIIPLLQPSFVCKQTKKNYYCNRCCFD
jgi:hypothetical protein